MALTWKWSTDTSKLSTSVKTSLLTEPKKWLLSWLVDKIKWVWAKTYKLTHSPEAEAIKTTITSPWKVISTWLRETSKLSWKVWEYLVKSWKQAEEAKIPVISQAWSITRAAWTLIWWVENTRQNILNIWEKVKKWEISTFDWILEAWTSAWLQWVTLIAAPFIQAINSWLNITWLDKPLEEWMEAGTNFLTKVTADTFWISEEKAKSRVNSALNVLRGATMYKWWKIIDKWWVWNFVKWSTLISSPDLTLSVLAFWAKEEWKELPKPEVLKWLVTNAALSFVPSPGSKIKSPKQLSLTEIAKTPKTIELKQTPETQQSLKTETTPGKIDYTILNQKEAKLNKLKEEYESFDFLWETQKIVDKYWKWTKEAYTEYRKLQSKRDALLNKLSAAREDYIWVPKWTFTKNIKTETTPTQKVETQPKLSEQVPKVNFKKQQQAEILAKYWKNKTQEIQNFIKDLATIQEIRKNPREFQWIYSANELLAMKKQAIKNGIKLWMIEPAWIDNWKNSYKFTETSKDFNISWNNEYLWIWVHTPTQTRGKKVSEQIIEKPADKIIENVIVDTPVEKKTSTKIPLSEQIKTTKNLPDFLKWDNIEAEKSKFPLTEWLKVSLNKVRKLTEKVKLWWVEKVLIDNVRWFLDNIVVTDKNWRRKTASFLVDWIIWEAKNFRNKTMNALWFDNLRKLEDQNTKAINAWYDFVVKNIDKYKTWEKIKDKIREIWTSTAPNQLFSRTSWEQWINSTKNRVLFDFTWFEIMNRIKNFEKETNQEINPAKTQEIINQVISELPKETQPYVKQIFDNYWQFWEDSIVQKWFQEIWEQHPELIPYLKENYYHWYVSQDKLREYFEATQWWDINAFLQKYEADNIQAIKNWSMPTPEQMAWILKKSRDVWFLHSYNPLDVINSYATELSRLKEQKEILSLFEELWKKDDNVKSFIDQNLTSDNNYLTKKLLWMWDYSKINEWVRKISKATALTKYVWNTAMMVQNLTFGALQWLWKTLYNLATDKATYSWISWKDKWFKKISNFVNNTLWDTRDYLFNQWLIAHKDFNLDKDLFKWNVPLSRKVYSQTKDIPNKWLRYFTATLIPQIQTIIASWFMNNVVQKQWWGIKEWETLVWAFKRTINSLSEPERRDIFWELSDQVTKIEDNTRLSSATSSVFDIPLFNMVKWFNRQNLSSIFHDMTDSIDILLKSEWKTKKDNIADREFSKTLWWDVSWLKANMTSLTTRTIWMLAVAKIMAEMFFEDEEEKAKFTEYIFAKDLKNYLANLVTSPAWFSGLDMVSWNIDALIQWVVWISNAEWEKAKIEEFNKMFFNIFTWLKKGKTALSSIAWDYTRNESKDWWYTYTDIKSTSPLWTFMWINPTSAAYSNLYNKLAEEKAKLPASVWEKLWNFMQTIQVFDSLSNAFDVSSKVNNAKLKALRTQVDNINRRIKEKQSEKMDFDAFLDNALWKDYWEKWELFKKNFKEKYIKNITSNLWTVNKLSSVVKWINYVKNVPLDFEDMNTTLNTLREVNPKLYNQFYSELYNSISTGNINPEVAELQKAFVDNVINRDMEWALLSTVIWEKLSDLAEQMVSKSDIITTEYDKLKALNEVIWLLNNSPELKAQIYDSLSQKITTAINQDNISKILEATKDFPELYDLYRRNAELRWATFIDENLEKKQEVSNIPKEETKLSWKITTKWTNIWILPTYSEKKKWKLINLIDIEAKQQTQPQLEKIQLQTLLDKVLK